MKYLIAYVRPNMSSAVIGALHSLPQCPAYTLQTGTGEGHGRGVDGSYAPPVDDFPQHACAVLQLICTDEQLPQLVATIKQAAHTGRDGDGRIAVMDVLQSVHI